MSFYQNHYQYFKKSGLNDDSISKIEGTKYSYQKGKNTISGEIKGTRQGIIGVITNNSYLNGVTHRAMRKSLLKTFDKIYILNLHGNSIINKPDKNVFDKKYNLPPDGRDWCIAIAKQKSKFYKKKFQKFIIVKENIGLIFPRFVKGNKSNYGFVSDKIIDIAVGGKYTGSETYIAPLYIYNKNSNNNENGNDFFFKDEAKNDNFTTLHTIFFCCNSTICKNYLCPKKSHATRWHRRLYGTAR